MYCSSTLAHIKRLLTELESQPVSPIQALLHDVRTLRNEIAELKELIRDNQTPIFPPQPYRVFPNTQPTVLKGEVCKTSGYTYTHPTPRPCTAK